MYLRSIFIYFLFLMSIFIYFLFLMFFLFILYYNKNYDFSIIAINTLNKTSRHIYMNISRYITTRYFNSCSYSMSVSQLQTSMHVLILVPICQMKKTSLGDTQACCPTTSANDKPFLTSIAGQQRSS